MPNTQMIMYEEEYQKISMILNELCSAASSKACYLVDQNGQLIAQAGQTQNIDATSLASLTAGSIAATSGLAKLLGEEHFSVLFHEGKDQHIHLTSVGGQIILVVIFDQRSTIGLVRLRVKKYSEQLAQVFHILEEKASTSSHSSTFREITDDDIDSLFQEDLDQLFRES
ncbi:MAG: roadblock/LC7 domain-containing protein [Bdellovibrionota bacterium]